MKDLAEMKLFQNIKDGKMSAIAFFLKCMAKDRGYCERQEVTGADGAPLSVPSPPDIHVHFIEREEPGDGQA